MRDIVSAFRMFTSKRPNCRALWAMPQEIDAMHPPLLIAPSIFSRFRTTGPASTHLRRPSIRNQDNGCCRYVMQHMTYVTLPPLMVLPPLVPLNSGTIGGRWHQRHIAYVLRRLSLYQVKGSDRGDRCIEMDMPTMTHPNLKPGAMIFENDPRDTTPLQLGADSCL